MHPSIAFARLSFVVFCFATLSDRVAIAQEGNIKLPILLVLQQDAELFSGQGKGSSTRQLRSGTILVGLSPRKEGDSDLPGWNVVTPDESEDTGWVRAGVVSPIESRVKELKATALALDEVGFGKKQSFPELILLQNNPATQRAWQEVSNAISENESLPEIERLPDPYFARAEIWASVKNYSDSLQDYLTAIKYARKANRDILTYSEYFDRLYSVAENLQNTPVPAQGAEPTTQIAARGHYSQGYQKFFIGQLAESKDRFDSAIQLSPDQPLYWYFRALTFKLLGDESRAQHDALMGASLERQLVSFRRADLNKELTRVQGPMRTWLETYRLGSPTNRLLVKYEILADANRGSK
jgi:tetratricopeptide (TPR) repeat protein